MTVAPVDPPRQPDTDGRFRFVRALVAVEASITAAEVVLLVGPALSLAAKSLHNAGDVRQVALVVGALMVLGWVRAADLLRPYLDAGFTGFTFNNNVYPRPEQIAAIVRSISPGSRPMSSQ